MDITFKCQLCERCEENPSNFCGWDSKYYFLCNKCYEKYQREKGIDEKIARICEKLNKRSELRNRIGRSRIYYKLHLFKNSLTLLRLKEQKDYLIWRLRK